MSDVLEVELYGLDGTVRLRTLDKRRNLRVTEELNGPGLGTVDIPVTALTQVQHDRVIKVRYRGSIVFAFVIEAIARVHVSGDDAPWARVSGRGLMCWLEDAVVYPAGGLTYYAPSERPFNFAATGAQFESDLVWTAPLGLKWTAATDYRKGRPKNWPDRAAYWIWKTNPASAVAADTTNWFRSYLVTTEAKRLRFFATADNYFRLYMDGALILSTSSLRGEGSTWNKLASRTMTIPAGSHRIAAVVTNGKNGSATNKAGFLFCVAEVDDTGKPTRVLRRSNTTNWQVSDDEPKMYPAEIVDALLDEAHNRAVGAGQDTRVDYLARGWTETEDSSGRTWSTKVATSVRCGTHLLDVVHQMVDEGIDFWADPANLELCAYETRGTDRTETILLTIAKNLSEYETLATSTGKTVALVRTADGWTTAADSAGVTERGRRESFLEFGNTRSEATGAARAARILKRTARLTNAVTRAVSVPRSGVRPFLNYKVGDRITAVSTTGTKAIARVLSLTLAEPDTGVLYCENELEFPNTTEVLG